MTNPDDSQRMYDTTKVTRTDVGEYFSNDLYNESGFTGTLELGDDFLFNEDSRLQIVVKDGEIYYLSDLVVVK